MFWEHGISSSGGKGNVKFLRLQGKRTTLGNREHTKTSCCCCCCLFSFFFWGGGEGVVCIFGVYVCVRVDA